MDNKLFFKKKFVVLLIIAIVVFCWCTKEKFFLKKNPTVFIESNHENKPEIVLHTEYVDMVNDWEESNNVLTVEDLKEMVGIKASIDSIDKNEKITVAVLDTGIFEHKRLSAPSQQVIGSVDLVNSIEKTYDDNGHGTAIAGIIAAFGVNGTYLDYKEDSFINFVSVKVLDYQCKGYGSKIVEGIKWVIENKDQYNIKIINISIGVPLYASEADRIAEVAKSAYDEGILVVTASGNIRDGVLQYSPAIEPTSISVGSIKESCIDETYNYSIAAFTTCWENHDLCYPIIYAPGCNIESLKSNIYYKGKGELGENNNFNIVSGTSASAAVVTGVVAYYMYYHPEKNIDEIREMIINSSISIWDEEKNMNYKFIHVGDV